MTDIQTIDVFSTPIDSLVVGGLSWKEYIESLSPADLEKQRQYDRMRVKKCIKRIKNGRENITKNTIIRTRTRY